MEGGPRGVRVAKVFSCLPSMRTECVCLTFEKRRGSRLQFSFSSDEKISRALLFMLIYLFYFFTATLVKEVRSVAAVRFKSEARTHPRCVFTSRS